MNQIIIPYGKRSNIILADGTHISLNSGSQLSYPTEFKAGSREVYLSGEAFFDVRTISGKPFYVVTRDVRIKVLGTRFNVSSYPDDNTTQTVLLKGKVSAGKNKLFAKTIDMAPGERMTYNRDNETLTKDNVDTNLYASWVNGYLIFKNEPIASVFKKLERYYNQRIVADYRTGNMTFSGKLDLKDNIKDVLENVSFASSVYIGR
jgi:transmembrane sensor